MSYRPVTWTCIITYPKMVVLPMPKHFWWQKFYDLTPFVVWKLLFLESASLFLIEYSLLPPTRKPKEQSKNKMHLSQLCILFLNISTTQLASISWPGHQWYSPDSDWIDKNESQETHQPRSLLLKMWSSILNGNVALGPLRP